MSAGFNVRARPDEHAAPGPVSVRIGAALWLAPIALPLISLFRNPAVTAPAELLTLVVAVLACARPDLGIAAGAALLPLCFTLGALLDLRFPFTEPMALAIVAGCSLRYVVKPRPLPQGACRMLAWPALLALLAAASAVVECAAQVAFYPSGAALATEIWNILTFHYFVDVGRFDGLRPALTMIEGLALLTITVAVAQGTRTRALLLGAMLAGGTAVAAQNVWRLCEVALRSDSGFWTAIARQMVGMRISAAFADVNTAGSYLVMVLVMAVVWWWRQRRAGAAAIVPLLALALWISGSRTAQAAGALALAPAIAPRRGRRWIGGVLVVAAVAALFAAQLFRTAGDPSSALFIRAELLKTGGRMLRTEPLFGVGIGRFYETSERFISPSLARYYVRENAHNQFLQVAGELGITGLVAFLAVLGIVLWRVVRDRSRPDPVRDSAAAGLLAFLLSAIGGHPLLVTEVALVFWIAVGLTWASSSGTDRLLSSGESAGRRATAAGAEAPAPEEPQAPVPRNAANGRRAFLLAIAILVLSLPWRIDRAAAALPLEHVGVEMSPWQRDEQGSRYRVMRGHAAMYVPARTEPSRFLARIDEGGPTELRLALSLDGQLVRQVILSHEWRDVTLIVPRSGRRTYRRVELTVTAADGTHNDSRVHIGIVR